MLGHQGCQRGQHVQRDLQPLALFSVDGERNISLGGALAQVPHARQQLAHHALALVGFKARVQGAELDGNSVILGTRPLLTSVSSYCFNSIFIARQIAPGIGVGARALAQHVETEAQVD